MSIIQGPHAKGTLAVTYASIAGAVNAQRFAITVPAAGAGTVLGDIIELACLPAGHRVVDTILDSADLDSGGPTLTLDVGIMSGQWGDPDQARTCGAEFFAASTVGQAGTAARPTLPSAFKTTRAEYNRSIGVKIAAAATTPAAGELGLTVFSVAG